MKGVWYVAPLLLATVVLADYYIDNANTAVVYSMPPSALGQAWQTFSVSTRSLALNITNSTGDYFILLDASHCYDENYALGVCGTADNCFVQMPFIGSGITMYVFNAGMMGMTASFSVDGGTAISSTIQAPPPPTYQVSNVALYNIQNLPTGNHTMKMTLLDWNGGNTSMKFDYAYVNETFVASPATTSSTSSGASTSASQTSTSSVASTSASQTLTSSVASTSSQTSTLSVASTSASHTSISSQTPTQTPAGSWGAVNKVSIGAILGGIAFLAGLLIGFVYLRKRNTTGQHLNVFCPGSTFQVPFTSEFGGPTSPSMPYAPQRPLSSQYKEATPSVLPFARSPILHDAITAGNYPVFTPDPSSQPTKSALFQPLRKPEPSHSDMHIHSGTSHMADKGSPFLDPQRDNLTAEQVEVIHRLQQDNVPLETIAHVIEGFDDANLSAREGNDRRMVQQRSFVSAAPPPGYQSVGMDDVL